MRRKQNQSVQKLTNDELEKVGTLAMSVDPNGMKLAIELMGSLRATQADWKKAFSHRVFRMMMKKEDPATFGLWVNEIQPNLGNPTEARLEEITDSHMLSELQILSPAAAKYLSKAKVTSLDFDGLKQLMALL